MQIDIKVFSEEEKQLVHKRTMEILRETGVWIKSPKAFEALKAAGAPTDDEKNIVFLIEDIKKEGPGGTYLAHKSSVKNFRNKDEMYYSKMFPSKLRGATYEKRDSLEIARKKVREILSGPITDALPEDVQHEIDAICAEADAGI